MDKRLFFRCAIAPPPKGGVVEVSFAEAEALALQRLENEKRAPQKALWAIAQFYKNARQHEKSLAYLHRLMALLPDIEEKANCVFTMGQAMENVRDYEAAVRYYREALSFEPASSWLWYFINNNLGFSLNALGRFAEGEPYCRRAIEIDPNLPNGFKNLGMSLSAQGCPQEAAKCFIQATRVNAADDRAFRLLEKLLADHPQLQFEFEADMECCREAIKVAAIKAESLRPVVHRGFKRRWILLKLRLAPMLKKLFRGKNCGH